MPKFTPGPWIVGKEFNPTIYSQTYSVAEVHDMDGAYTDSETLANARLIAAAPDLYNLYEFIAANRGSLIRFFHGLEGSFSDRARDLADLVNKIDRLAVGDD